MDRRGGLTGIFELCWALMEYALIQHDGGNEIGGLVGDVVGLCRQHDFPDQS